MKWRTAHERDPFGIITHTTVYVNGICERDRRSAGFQSAPRVPHFSAARHRAATTAVAAGAILSMIVDTMIPEAFQSEHNDAGLITVAGFLAAFALSKLG